MSQFAVGTLESVDLVVPRIHQGHVMGAMYIVQIRQGDTGNTIFSFHVNNFSPELYRILVEQNRTDFQIEVELQEVLAVNGNTFFALGGEIDIHGEKPKN